MHAILKYYWQICLLKAGPENMPNSYKFCTLLGLTYLVTGTTTILLSQPALSFIDGIIATAITLVIIVVMLELLLRFKRLSHRLAPSLAAFLGCNIIIQLVLLPLDLGQSTFETGIIADLFNLASIISFFWWFAISGFVLSRSLNLSLPLGIATAFLMEILQSMSVYQLFIQPLSS